jgi:Zn-dependent protease with chaperone function
MRVKGGYYDGRLALRQEVELSLEGGALTLKGEGIALSYPLEQVIATEGVGSIRRTLRLPDSGSCDVADQEFIAQLEGLQGRGKRAALLHRWEKSLPLALGALLLTGLVVLLFLRFGVPAMARQVAFKIPPAAESTMGRETIAILDRLLLKPSKLDEARRKELTSLFKRVGGNSSTGSRLEFRSSEALGANAFALPSGIVILTDGMVELANSDDEIAAVLAHELGHVRQRHIMRHVLQNSVTALVVATLTGDITSITSLAATLPTAVVDATFSRQFEREADDAAVAWLKSAQVDPRRYAELLSRLQAQLDTRSGDAFKQRNPAHNYLSNHPDTGERIRRILAAGV